MLVKELIKRPPGAPTKVQSSQSHTHLHPLSFFTTWGWFLSMWSCVMSMWWLPPAGMVNIFYDGQHPYLHNVNSFSSGTKMSTSDSARAAAASSSGPTKCPMWLSDEHHDASEPCLHTGVIKYIHFLINHTLGMVYIYDRVKTIKLPRSKCSGVRYH